MLKQLRGGVAVLALSGLSLLSACAPANFSGGIGENSLGAMGSAYFSAYEDNAGISLIYFFTEAWTCEEIQAASETEEGLQADDPEKVLGAISIFPYIKGGDGITAAEGEYRVVDDVFSAIDLNENALFALFYVSFSNESNTVAENENGEVGSFTLSSVDIAKAVSGEVSVTLSSGELIEGSFKATRCDL